MKKGTRIACALIALAGLAAMKKAPLNPSWKLRWSDEFNYSGLPDSSKWSYDVGGGGWGNNELQYYTRSRAENARVEKGNLVIEARKENWNGKEYTSARLVTRGKEDWTYGKVEVRAKLPAGRGTWPAIWMLGSKKPFAWPDDGEIDIMEEVGYDPGIVHASIHTKSYNHIIGTQKTAIIPVMDCSTAFHVYGLQWGPEELSISVDDSTYFHFRNEHRSHDTWPFSDPMHLLLNIAVGGNWGGQKGVDTTIFPQQMLVDYVRVYEKN